MVATPRIVDLTADPPIKTYRRHRCDKEHRTFRTWAKCAWPYAMVSGEGQWAAVQPCRRWSIDLFSDKDEAIRKLGWSCGGVCSKDRHHLVRIVR